MIVGNLPKRISPVRHAAEVLDRGLVILDRIHHRSGIEEVVAAQLLLGRIVIILTGLLTVAKHEAGLRNNARKPLLPLLWRRFVKTLSLLGSELVILPVKLTVNDIELCQILETRVGSGLQEKFLRSGKILPVIVDHSAQIPSRSIVFRGIQRLQQGKELQGLLMPAQRELAICAFEYIFRHIGRRDGA